MEEITHLGTTPPLVGSGKKKNLPDNVLIDIIIREYKDIASPSFGRNSSTVRSILLRKYPQYKLRLLGNHSSTYSTTRTTTQPKAFRGTSFYSPHPHYRWHTDLQDMTIFKKAGKASKKGVAYNFMLICVDDFSNFFMVELIKNKRAATVLNAMLKIIQSQKRTRLHLFRQRFRIRQQVIQRS